jgi:hypothetical protein
MAKAWIGGALGLMLALTAGARAGFVVTIDDRSDKISIDVTGLPQEQVRITKINDESQGVTLKGVLPAVPATATEAEFNLKEPANSDGSPGSVSDGIAFFTSKFTKDYTILMVSDLGELPLSVGTPYGDAEETGGFQVFKLNPDPAKKELPLPQGAPDMTLRVASDVGVPEPSSLVLVGLGVIGLAIYGRGRSVRSSRSPSA